MKFSLLVLGVLLAVPLPAESHRLDEYLQASRLAFSRDRVVVELDLTPGVSVAPHVFAMIDGDRDARVSALEIEAYARRVLQDLSLRIDGRPRRLTLGRAESPSWDELRDGVGTIRLEAFTEPGLATHGRHSVVYENSHESASAVYLVNVLIPSAGDMIVGAQRRDMLQRRIAVDVDVTMRLSVLSWSLLTGGAVSVLLMTRRQ